jgi:hypothetical protein
MRTRDIHDLQIVSTAEQAAQLVGEDADRAHALTRFLIAFADAVQSLPPVKSRANGAAVSRHEAGAAARASLPADP